MKSTIRRSAAGLVATLSILAVVGNACAQRGDARRPEARGVVKAVDVGGNSITVSVAVNRENVTDKVYSLAPNAEVAVGSAGFGRGITLLQEGKLGDIQPGVSVSLSLSADEKTVESILAEEPSVRGVIQKVDAAAKTLSVVVSLAGRGQPEDVKSLSVADDAEIGVDDGRGRRFSIREATLDELAQGASVVAWLSLDRQKVRAILAEGPTLTGTIKAIDANTRNLTLTIRPARGDESGEERSIVIAPEATILLDDGRGKRLSIKGAKLSDIPVGASATVRLSTDQGRAMQVRAEGPTVFGVFKSTDAEKKTITISISRGREAADERTLTVAGDARIVSEGTEVPLANLKAVDNGPLVMLKLSLDQSKVQQITAIAPGRR